MVRFTLIVVLIISAVCLVPLAGSGHDGLGDSHHDMGSHSCGTCLGPLPAVGDPFKAVQTGTSVLVGPASLPSAPSRTLFRPPRSH